MELKTVIEADGNFVDSKYRHVTINNQQQLQTYLTDQLSHAFERLNRHPIIVLHRKLTGHIVEYFVDTKPTGSGLAIYVANKYKRTDGKNFVFNPLRGNTVHIADEYVIMNTSGKQLWPHLAENALSEVEKFANRTFNEIYKVEKVR